MPKAVFGGLEMEIDEDGFIQEPEKWSAAVAEDLAKTEEVEKMGEDHWNLVNYIRDYYLQFGVAVSCHHIVARWKFFVSDAFLDQH